MDVNPSENEEKKIEAASHNTPAQEEKKEEPKQEKPKLQFSNPKLQQIAEGKFYMPKLKLPNFKEKFAEYSRVLKVTKKPDSEEFKATVKAAGLGIIVIGMLGFIIAIIVQLLKML